MNKETAELNRQMAEDIQGWELRGSSWVDSDGNRVADTYKDTTCDIATHWNPAGDDPQSLGQAESCVRKWLDENPNMEIDITSDEVGKPKWIVMVMDITDRDLPMVCLTDDCLATGICKALAKAIGKGDK